MRSKVWEPGQVRHGPQAQGSVQDRFGAVLVASTGVLCVEATVGGLALVAWTDTQENPGLVPGGLAFVVILLLPVVIALFTLVSVGVVMPLLTVAEWWGRHGKGRVGWWWVPTLAAAGTAPFAVLAAVHAGIAGAVAGWLVANAALAGPALVARRLLLPGRPWLSGRAMFWRVAAYGSLAVVAAAIAGVGLSAGLGYAPPRLSTQQVAGTWTDGKGGSLVLTSDGKVTANGVRVFDLEDVHTCTGTGTWSYNEGAPVWSQGVSVSVAGCDDMDTWQVLGTTEHPKLYVFIGDPDDEDLYVLRHRG
jgi:hypothetical protein